MTTRRSRESILVSILKACTADKLTVSRLMGALNLQHTKLTDYLTHLAAANLIEYQKRDGKRVVATTNKGAEAVRSYRNALALLGGYALARSANERANEREERESIQT